MSAINYKQSFYEGVSQLIWRQWGQMGIAAHSSGHDANFGYVLDPEALVLFSSAFCRYDQRLYDLMAGWMQVYGGLLKPTRLKAMTALSGYKDAASLSYLAALCVQAGDKRWKRMSEWYDGQGIVSQPMFFSAQDGQPVYCSATDELAMKYGFIRNPYERGRKLRRKFEKNASTLLLHLRGLLGVSARAEVVMLLLDAPMGIQQLAERSGFARSVVKSVLDELIMSNWACAVSLKGCRKVYKLNESEHFAHLCGAETVCFPEWRAIYEALGKIWQFLSSPHIDKVSDATFEGELRRLFRTELQPQLLHCGIKELENLTESSSLSELPEVLCRCG